MRKRYEEHTEDIVTQFKRPNVKMPRPKKRTEEEPSESTLPNRLRFNLTDGSLITEIPLDVEMLVGRRPRTSDPSVSVDLEAFDGQGKGVSRVHAMIVVLRDKIMLQDLQSINGTQIDGERLAPLKKYPLIDGANLTFGTLSIIVTFVYD